MADRTPPSPEARDPWRQANAAQVIATEASNLLFERLSLTSLDPRTRAELMEAADTFVARLIEDHVPDDDPRPDDLQAWRDQEEASR